MIAILPAALTRMLQVASAGSSSTCSFRNRTLMRPSAIAWFAPLASSTMSVKQLYTCTSQVHVHQ